MSFQVFYQTCRFAEIVVLPEEPLTPEELRAVEQVLESVRTSDPSDPDCIHVEVSDGGTAVVYCSELDTGCMVSMRCMTPGLGRFLFDLLKAGNWMIFPVGEEGIAMTTAPQCQKNLPEDFLAVGVCQSAEELYPELVKPFVHWREMRDRLRASR